MSEKQYSKAEIEEGSFALIKYDHNGLVPVVTTDHHTGEVLMMAYMNDQALRKTVETGEAHYWSRSRQELWHKGGTSGQVQTVHDIRTDCDQDAIWIRVSVQGDGGCCHVGYQTCFYRRFTIGGDPEALEKTDIPKVR